MSVKGTSRKAFKVSARKVVEQLVMEQLTTAGPATRADLAHRLQRGVNTITAGVLALLAANLIEESDRVIQAGSGRLAWQLRIKDIA